MGERLAGIADRLTGVGRLKPQVLEVLGSTQGDGVLELEGYEIAERIVEFHPRKGGAVMIGQGTLYKALGQLTESGRLVRRRVGAEEAIETSTDTRYVYRISEPPTSSSQSGQ